jgi:hypothetical protein
LFFHQAVTIDENFEVRHIDSKSIARESAQTLLEDCQNSVISAIEKDITLLAHNAVQMVSECIFQSVSLEMEKASEEIRFQASLRTKMAGHFENATCADFELPSSEPIATNIWRHKGVSRKVETLLERDASKVHVITNFISEEECNAMVEERAKSSLHSSAKVADGKGRREELSSPTRKAMHAGIKIPWHQEDDGNPLTTVSRKVYDYVNDVLDLNIEEHGQEDLMSIHYFGRGKNGKNDTVPADRYMPHCDGDCDGMTHRDGQRMASIIMYCTIPEKGGATIFRNSGLHIVPERLSATFVSYIDPDTFVMDNGFTEHSGCPVIEGEKHIVIQWVRYGVDDENPWDSSFNTRKFSCNSYLVHYFFVTINRLFITFQWVSNTQRQ